MPITKGYQSLVEEARRKIRASVEDYEHGSRGSVATCGSWSAKG